MLTLDVPLRQKRVHDVRNGLVVPFRFRPRTVFDIARAPLWAMSMLQKGQPRFENLRKYVGESASNAELAGFVHARMTTGITWEDIARFREICAARPGTEGHPAPGGRGAGAAALGGMASGCSNRWRQAIRCRAGGDRYRAGHRRGTRRAREGAAGRLSTRSGLDVFRSLAAGADFTFSGRAFLLRSPRSARRAAIMRWPAFQEEIRGTFGQGGVRSVEEAMRATVLHPGAIRFDPPGERRAAGSAAAAPGRGMTP